MLAELRNPPLFSGGFALVKFQAEEEDTTVVLERIYHILIVILIAFGKLIREGICAASILLQLVLDGFYRIAVVIVFRDG